MRIIFTSDLSGLGGGEMGIVYLAEELSKQHDCLVVCRKEGKLSALLKLRKIQVSIVDYKNKANIISSIRQTVKTIKLFSPDVIVSNDPMTSIIMSIAKGSSKTKNIWMCHGQWYEFNLLKRCLLGYALDKCLCVSDVVRKSIESQGLKNCETLHLGVPTDLFKNAEPIPLRDQYGIEEGALVLGTIARFQPIKGQLKCVEICKRLKDEGRSFIFVFIGGSTFDNDDDLRYEQEVRSRVTDYDLNEKVLFLGERTDVPQLMQSLDLLVIPSENESLGVVALEASASSLPFVSTPNEGVAEITMNNRFLIAEKSDAQSLYKLVNGYFCEPRKIDKAKIEIGDIAKRFDISSIANRFVSCVSNE